MVEADGTIRFQRRAGMPKRDPLRKARISCFDSNNTGRTERFRKARLTIRVEAGDVRVDRPIRMARRPGRVC